MGVGRARPLLQAGRGAATEVGGDYMRGSSIRQDWLAAVLGWTAGRHGMGVEEYMGAHQFNPTAQELWTYFRAAIDWARTMFPHYRHEMKGLPWEPRYDANHTRTDLDSARLEKQVSELMADEDVTRRSGVYAYVLDGDERHLSIRVFDKRTQRATYERQNGLCVLCGRAFDLSDMHDDHIVPWSKGGHTTPDNCQMLCRDCNLRKGGR